MPDNKPEALGEHIRQLRKQRAWSQEQVAGAADLSLRTIQRVENGFVCSPDTLQALAAAFEIDAGTLSALQRDKHRNPKWLGLNAKAAPWAGLVLCLPATYFIITNIGFYELGWTWLEPVLLTQILNGAAAHPVIILGGPLLAMLLNAPHLFSLRARGTRDGELIEGVLISWNAGRFAILIFAACLVAILLSYIAGENFLHFIDALISARQ